MGNKPQTTKHGDSKKQHRRVEGISATLRVTPGFLLSELSPSDTPGYHGTKHEAVRIMKDSRSELDELQERLYAGGRDGDGPAVLLLLQGMDTAGKGGIVRHVVGSVDPQGVSIHAFKKPTAEELAHPFLWRIRQALPGPGFLGVFDRSQYEDVLVARVHHLVPPSVWRRRYAQINSFEKTCSTNGIHFIKVMLHVSADEQKARLAERLERPDKYWKFSPSDIDEREFWAAYQEAYQAIMDKTSTTENPWYVVPSDHKWYARLTIQQLLLEQLRSLELPWPPADFDIAEQQRRLAAT
jgi:PPK2 family polyphosphate:nucleotide phosphotransferase